MATNTEAGVYTGVLALLLVSSGQLKEGGLNRKVVASQSDLTEQTSLYCTTGRLS